MVIITTDGKQHKVIEKEQIFVMDIYYFKYMCEDGVFYTIDVIDVIKN